MGIVLLLTACLAFPAAAEEIQTSNPIVGSWHGSASIWFLASGSGEVTFYDDNTAFASGTVTVIGQKKTYTFPKLTWEKVSDDVCLGHFGWRTLPFTYNGRTITAPFNSYELGGTPIPLFNINIPIRLTRL